MKDQCQLNLADKGQPADPNTQGQGESSQPNAADSSNQPSADKEGGQSGVDTNNESQGNKNENSTETQGSFIQPPAEEPTPGDLAGLTPFEEGLLTNYLNKAFKRNKQNRRK